MWGSIGAGIFENKSDAVRTILRAYFEQHDDDHIAAAVHCYEQEDTVRLGTAARLAGLSEDTMRERLRTHGVDIDSRESATPSQPDSDDPSNSGDQNQNLTTFSFCGEGANPPSSTERPKGAE